MTDRDFTLAPVRSFASERLLGAQDPTLLPPGAELIADIERAMLLENAQDLPPGYRIWRDVINAALSPFYSAPAAAEGRVLIEAEADAIWSGCGEFEQALKISQLRKTITPFEEFWLTIAYDLFELLQSVSLGRHVNEADNDPVLEAIFCVVQAGFYPCGWNGESGICAFDPRELEGFRPVW
ncbi:hypothetical protein GRI97_02330 [Altererythrobacter xixiisoli]|uniref:Uncharacterized protein n=1 Tax=Croceibacterium xixiisoli TaxID=1476466 RepID=A0A6I4TPG4_9SPHN|nr:hypothetical protein [Croceibacterium xixiisoli]MXO97824.1 hypothetical protein [Croceibacterium xixiisoli]